MQRSAPSQGDRPMNLPRLEDALLAVDNRDALNRMLKN